MFPCEICEIFKNTYFYRTPPETASEILHVERFEYFHVDKGLILNVNKTFNVLCTFNVCPVSTGLQEAKKTNLINMNMVQRKS